MTDLKDTYAVAVRLHQQLETACENSADPKLRLLADKADELALELCAMWNFKENDD
jgi:uncharacterized protein YeaC (DUF1315 family)